VIIMGKQKLNILPVPTYNWLGVNYAERDISEYETAAEVISAAENEEKTCLFWVDDNAASEVSIQASENSYVKLVQVFDVKGQAVSKVSAELADNGRFELVQLYLGGDVVSEIDVKLDGRKSKFDASIGYKLGDSDKLDLNLIADHKGRKTESVIAVKGVLDGDAVKTFKGTIDFKNGAVGAKGAEQEEVLLLSEQAVNKTVPLILCAEEDVEGSHGASIGRVDEKHIFYMQSRGIPEEKITELMAQSKIAQVVNKIDNEQTVKRILGRLGRGDDNE